MVKIEINERKPVYKNERVARAFLEHLAEGVRKHPYHIARIQLETLEARYDSWRRNIVYVRTEKQREKEMEFIEAIRKAQEAFAMIDPPAPISVKITKIN